MRWCTSVAASVTLTVLLVLTGCAAVWKPQEHQLPQKSAKPPAPVSADHKEVTDDVGRLMEDAGLFSRLSASERQSALDREEKRYRQRRTPYNLMRLALLMALAEPGHGRTDEVVAALRDYAAEQHGQAYLAALAAFLSQVLEQHDGLLGQNDTLQRKLNELKAIEQKLNEQNKRDMIQVPP